MTTVLTLILLPLRAPMVLLLLLVSTYLGLHWSRPGSWADAGVGGVTDLIWSAECLQALMVVVVCTMPDLLLRRLSSIMAASRVASLVVTLLLVVTGGLYLLHLDVLSNVLILSSSVLLARLDLVRLRVVPPPFVMTLVLSLLVLGGISLGRLVELQLHPGGAPAQEIQAPTSSGRAQQPARGSSQPASSASKPVGSPEPQRSTAATPATGEASPATETRGSSGQSAATSGQPAASPTSATPASASQRPARRASEREPDRAIPHLQPSVGQDDVP
jgi:hypothetical protein